MLLSAKKLLFRDRSLLVLLLGSGSFFSHHILEVKCIGNLELELEFNQVIEAIYIDIALQKRVIISSFTLARVF
jgi:hypothetical protein